MGSFFGSLFGQDESATTDPFQNKTGHGVQPPRHTLPRGHPNSLPHRAPFDTVHGAFHDMPQNARNAAFSASEPTPSSTNIAGSRSFTAAVTAPLREFSSHQSYHGKMTGREAGKILKKQGGTCYLTRYSESNKKYMLSVGQKKGGDNEDEFVQRDYRLNVKKQANKLSRVTVEIEGSEEQFHDLPSMLNYYRDTAVDHDVASIGSMVKAKRPHLSKSVTQDDQSQSEQSTQKNRLDLCLDNTPTHADLKNIKWTNEQGETKYFNLILQVSSTWREVALRLGLSMDAIENYRQKTDDNVERFEYVMSYWLENCAEHEDYPATWRGLMELLRAVERSTAAEELKKVLKQQSRATS